MSSLRWHGRVAVALAFSGLVVGAHVAVASPGGAAATRGYRAQTLAWQPCAGQLADLECATVRVPLDYGSPDGPTMNVAISRLRTGSAAKRRGIMLLNPGGPGGGGVSMPLDMRSRFPRDVLEQYDLVGFDPRGVRGSDRVTCQAPAAATTPSGQAGHTGRRTPRYPRARPGAATSRRPTPERRSRLP